MFFSAAGEGLLTEFWGQGEHFSFLDLVSSILSCLILCQSPWTMKPVMLCEHSFHQPGDFRESSHLGQEFECALKMKRNRFTLQRISKIIFFTQARKRSFDILKIPLFVFLLFYCISFICIPFFFSSSRWAQSLTVIIHCYHFVFVFLGIRLKLPRGVHLGVSTAVIMTSPQLGLCS